MAWRIQITGTTAEVGTAVNALTVPASEGAVAAGQLARAKTYINSELLLIPLLATGPVRLEAEGKGQGNGSFLRVDLTYVRLVPGTKGIIEPPPNV